MLPSSSKSPSSSPYKSKNKFNYCSNPQFPIQLKNKVQIISLQISEHGRSGGIIFIQTTVGSFVLKANNETSHDYFYNQLALLLDVNTPLMSTIACYQQQFQNLVYCIQKYCHKDQVLYARLKSKLDFPFYQLIQYIPSISLTNIGVQKYRNSMLTDYKMYTVGICLAFDMIINNSDRYTFANRGQGNINNILIQILPQYRKRFQQCRDRNNNSVKLGNFMYIDHDGHMVNYEDQLAKVNVDKYMQKLSQFQLGMIQYLLRQTQSYPMQFQKLNKQINFFTQYQYKQQDIVRISEGIVYCTKKFIDLYENKTIHNLHQSIIKPIDTKNKQINYWNQYWNSIFKKVYFNFCQVFYIKISAIYSTYPELINKIYDKVNKLVDQNKDKNINKEYQKSRKNSDLFSDNGKDNNNQDLDNDLVKPIQPEQKDQAKKEGSKRKWRQKLQKFKVENYR